MQRFQGLIGIVVILGIAFLCSNNKKRINYRLVGSGILLQVVIAILVLRVPFVTSFFKFLGRIMGHIEDFAKAGANFVYGGVIIQNPTPGAAPVPFSTEQVPKIFLFGFNVTATIILVCALVAIFYHFGIMQRLVSIIAKGMHWIMRVSGAEALSNVASAFVGQVEAQVMIRPYLAGMTMSELLASMSGSLACIAGGILIVYVNFGASAEYLLTASLMAAPGALVISKIVWPETEESQTMGKVKLKVESPYRNVIDAISHGAGDGFKIAMNVIAMIIGFVAVIALLDFLLGKFGFWFRMDTQLSLKWLFSKLFYPMAWAMGVPTHDVSNVALLMGEKLTINEFVAFYDLTHGIQQQLSPKGLLIVSFAICGFANFSSVGMQIGGIGELAPNRRTDLARLGMRALLCGTLASYLSATLAGILAG